MTLAVLKSRTTYVRLATLFIILSTYKLIIVLWSQTVFEHSLSSLYIIPEDFSLRAEKGSNYTEALLAAGKDYFNFTYPPLDSNPHFTIPPKIHFIFFPDLYAVRPSGPVIAHAGSDAPSICIDRNPNFTIKIWDTNEARRLLEDHYAWFLPVYDGYRHPIQRVDAIKYFILWHYGGIYLDLDISCRKGLQPLLDFPAWMPRASPLGVNNDAMAARAGHPLMWRMIESLRRRDRNLVSSWLTIFWTTGPKFVSDMLREYLVGHDVCSGLNS
jgi:mannosyltransferase OCH1-like enzyme